MMIVSCNCCGLQSDKQNNGDCSRCGYPVDVSKEVHFLETSIHDLKRIGEYGGAKMTVTKLIKRYQLRLNTLHALMAALEQMPSAEPVAVIADEMLLPENMPGLSKLRMPATPFDAASSADSMESTLSVPLPGRVFSFTSFFADQTINIVASLGAFMVLVGSLSYIATTTDVWRSFLVMFLVQVLFGITGIITYRFQSFRTVAVIYTAIFALLVPLTGFSGYRLVLDNLVPLSPPTLVAITAAYATVVYGAVAVYQRFRPFAYLAVVSVAVAALAVALAYHLNYWWWPTILMLLAFPSLLSVMCHSGTLWPFAGATALLREPVHFLMNTCVAVCGLGVVLAFLYSLILDSAGYPLSEARFAILSMLLLLLAWTCLFVWMTKSVRATVAVAYLFVACMLALSYALNFHAIGYVIALTLVALLYHGLNRFASRLLLPCGKLGMHLDGLALILVGIVPFVGSPLILSQLFVRSYAPSFVVHMHVTRELLVEIITLLIGCVLTISIVLSRAGLQISPAKTAARWCHLLLLSGFLFTWVYAILVLLFNLEPTWCFFGLTLAFVMCTTAVRHLTSSAWSNPLDILALGATSLTIALGDSWNPSTTSLLLLCFVALSYGVIYYQARGKWLFLPLIFAILALPSLLFFSLSYIAFLVAIALPLVSVAVRRFGSKIGHSTVLSAVAWEWPLVTVGVLYATLYVATFSLFAENTIWNELGIRLPFSLVIACLALVWYVSAILARVKWWLFIAMGFAAAALLVPPNSFWILAWLAPATVLAAYVVSRVIGREWVAPLYVSAVLAAVIMGVAGYTQGQIPTATLSLLVFALVVYLIGIAEDATALTWLAPIFATWSIYDAMLLGDLYRPPSAALLCAALGVGISCLKFFSSVPGSLREKLLRFALPLYATAAAAAILTGIGGMLLGVNHPFYAATPSTLLVFALVAYGVLLFERKPELLVFPVALAAWAIAQTPWSSWQQMIAYSLLCVIIFASQFVWNFIQPATRLWPAVRIHTLLSLGGQALVVLAILAQGGLSTRVGLLSHSGAASLLVLAALILWYGQLQTTSATQRSCAYVAGLLVAWVVSWELLAFGQTHMDVLYLAPATYFVVVAPFLSRDEALPQHYHVARMCSIIGATLLLLPTLWLSFSQDNLQPTLILAGESLALLLLGIGTRVRIFVLSGAGLAVIGAIHALFLPTLGLPPSLALAILGGMLLAIATALTLARHRLQTVWTQWE